MRNICYSCVHVKHVFYFTKRTQGLLLRSPPSERKASPGRQRESRPRRTGAVRRTGNLNLAPFDCLHASGSSLQQPVQKNIHSIFFFYYRERNALTKTKNVPSVEMMLMIHILLEKGSAKVEYLSNLSG